MLDISPYTFTVTQFYIAYSNSGMSILYILKLFFSNIITTTAETICKTKKIAPCTCIILAGLHANKAFHAYGCYTGLADECGRNLSS